MQRSKLIALLKSLENSELHWLQKFLHSPFYNSNEQVVQLFSYLRKYHPDFTASGLSKEKAFAKLFPGEAMDQQKLRKYMHELARLVEEFLVVMALKKDGLKKEKLLIHALGERNLLYIPFKKATLNLAEALTKRPYRDAASFHHLHQLHLNYYNHVQTTKHQENVEVLYQTLEELDYYYLLQRQQIELTLIWHNRLLGNVQHPPSLEEAAGHLSELPVYRIYNKVTKLIQVGWSDELYQKLENLFKERIDEIAHNDQLEIIRILLNFLSGQINRGREAYQFNMLELYKFGLARELFFEGAQMGETIFSNIATVGTLVGDFPWVKEFIKEYSPYLPAPVRQDATRLSLSLLYFHEGAFDEAINELSHQEFTQALHTLKARSILLRAYFEKYLEDDTFYDLVIAQTNAFEKFVRRNEAISEAVQTHYLQFIQFTRSIAQSVSNHSISSKLYNKIKATKSVPLRSWLLEKVKPFI